MSMTGNVCLSATLTCLQAVEDFSVSPSLIRQTGPPVARTEPRDLYFGHLPVASLSIALYDSSLLILRRG